MIDAELVQRIRDRIASGRAVDLRRRMSLGVLQKVDPSAAETEIAGLKSLIDRTRSANLQGGALPVDVRSELIKRVQRMKAVAPVPDPLPLSGSSLDAAEQLCGVAMPELLVNLYRQVADGGFGPGYGLLPLAGIAELYRKFRFYGGLPGWPKNLLPITDDEDSYYCLDLTDGSISMFDPYLLNDENSNLEEAFKRLAAGLEAWLTRWLDGPTEEEKAAFEARKQALFEQAREASRQRVEAYLDTLRDKPDERARLGFPGDDWEEKLRRSLLPRS